MGILGTDYTLRYGHVIFLLLVASSVLLGFSYLNEMYQRIHLQEKIERKMQHIIAERSIIQHKSSLLQEQIDSRKKELTRLQEIHTSQRQQLNSICEKEKIDLLQTISSKNYTITEVQTQYESLKNRFEHLRSVMEQFENNQSRLLEKFSTQSTQCMNVINRLSALCNEGKGNVFQKIATVTKQNKTSVNRAITQLSSSLKAAVSTLLESPPLDFSKSEWKHSTKLSNTSPPTKDTILESDQDKQSSLNALQKIQEMVSELNSTNMTKDNEDEILKLEKIQNSTEENVFKLQTDKSEETAISEKQTTEQQTRDENLPALNEVSESAKPKKTKIEKVVDSKYPMLLSKNERLQSISLNRRTADRIVFTKEELTDEPTETNTLTEDNAKKQGEAYIEVKQKPQGLSLQKVKTPDGDTYKAEEEFEYENNTEDLELTDQEISKIIL